MNVKYILSAFAAGVLTVGLSACDSDDLNPVSVFPDVDDVINPDSYTYKFDKWLDVEYGERYNCEFRYKMQHISTDMDYHLVPATLDNAVDMALLVKYLWYDVYDEVTGDDTFLKLYGPKILHLIGSPAYNPANHTKILGLAEGGLKVSLFQINSMNAADPDNLNEHYFKTMHHEFAHILHQTKTYPVEFNLINNVDYEPSNWQDRNGAIVNSLGFTTHYASSQAREDFAETCANYITRSDDQWELLLWIADRGWDNAKSDDYVYAYYYYANDDDKENDVKTFVGEYINPEDNNGVFGITDRVAAPGKDGNYERTDQHAVYTNVADVEAYFAKQKEKYDLMPLPDTDGKNGKENILKKLEIARNWFKTAWNLDIDALRAEVQARQKSLLEPQTMDDLRAQIEAVE